MSRVLPPLYNDGAIWGGTPEQRREMRDRLNSEAAPYVTSDVLSLDRQVAMTRAWLETHPPSKKEKPRMDTFQIVIAAELAVIAISLLAILHWRRSS
jgi:hypothetical protein